MVYLKEVENRLISTSSERDLSLYSFLNGRKYSIRVAPNDIESELCINAFSDGNGEACLTKLRKVKPFKGLHYTNNFVLLIAAAKIDAAGEEEHIREYLSSHSHKEQVIINCALGTEYRIATKTEDPIAILAYRIEENENINEVDIQNCLSSISDLYDLFILEKAISMAIFQANEEKNVYSYRSLVDMQKKALGRVEFVFFILLFIIFSYIVYLTVPTIVGMVVKNWDTLEPLAYIIDKTVIVFFLITGVVLATKVKSIKRIIKGYFLNKIYRLLGIDYSKYQKLIEIINSNKEHKK